MNSNDIFKAMPLTAVITNFSPDRGFERIYLATGHKPDPSACNQYRNKQAKTEVRSSWNGRRLLEQNSIKTDHTC
jgi:hypothetical protein